jgi:hypothetical protein
LGVITGHTQLFRCPEAEKLVPAGIGLELQFLVEGEFLFVTLFAIVKARHRRNLQSPAKRGAPTLNYEGKPGFQGRVIPKMTGQINKCREAPKGIAWHFGPLYPLTP